jgi:hypothetical protein
MNHTYYLFWPCIFYGLYNRAYVYSLAFFILFSTSYLIYNHDGFSLSLYILDRLAIVCVILVGAYYLYYYTIPLTVPLLCFTCVLLVYFNKHFARVNANNCLVHALTVVGHLAIMHGISRSGLRKCNK